MSAGLPQFVQLLGFRYVGSISSMRTITLKGHLRVKQGDFTFSIDSWRGSLVLECLAIEGGHGSKVTFSPVAEVEVSIDTSSLKDTPITLALGNLGDVKIYPPSMPNIGSNVYIPVRGLSIELLAKALGVPDRGVPLGLLASTSQVYDYPLYLPYSTLFQHVLFVGSTGSGKTSMLKNMIAWLATVGRKVEITGVGERNINILIVDIAGDYAHIGLPRLSSQPEPEKPFNRINPPSEVNVLLPVSKEMVAEFLTKLLERDERGISIRVKRQSAGVGSPEATFTRMDIEQTPEDEREQKIAEIQTEITHAVEVEVSGISESELRREFLRYIGEQYVRARYEVLGRSGLKYEIATEEDQVVLRVGGLTVRVVPFALEYQKLATKLPDILPLNELQRDSYKRIIRRMPIVWKVDSLDKHIDMLKGKKQAITKTLGAASQTIDAIVRRLLTLSESLFVDVRVKTEDGVFSLKQPDFSRLSGVVVLDLDFPQAEKEIQRILAFFTLKELADMKFSAWKRGLVTDYWVVFVDEAHEFFPKDSGLSGAVQAMLDHLCRRGRARGIGVVFATHMPQDLTPIVNQNTNTKVVLRCERQALSALGLEKYIDLVRTFSRDYRRFLVVSSAFRHVLLGKPSPPAVAHFDLSTAIKE